MPMNPRAHALGREAANHVRDQLPGEWHSEEVAHDYGRDLIYEIVIDGLETGLEFRVQSKGHERVDVVYGNTVAQPLKVSTLNYFDSGMLPVMLAVYDASDRRAYYEWVQEVIANKLDSDDPDWRARSGNSEITLHVPRTNVVNLSACPAIVEYVETWRALHGLSGGKPPDRLRAYFRHKARLLYFEFQSTLPTMEAHLPRPNLIDRVVGCVAEGAVLLLGSSGYGKTRTACESAHRLGQEIGWYEIRQQDASPLRLVEGLAVSLFRVTDTVGGQTLAYLDEIGGSVTAEEALALLLEELEEVHVVLVVEQCEAATDETWDLLGEIVKRSPQGVSLILTASQLTSPARRLFSKGELQVIDETELRWSSSETKQYLRDTLRLTASDSVCESLSAATEGWPAAIAMAGRMLAGMDDTPESLVESLSGRESPVYEYFAENVYEFLPAETQWLLKRLSLLSEFDDEDINVVARTGEGGVILRQLRTEAAFVSLTDSARAGCRIHRLFGEYLKERFREEDGETTLKLEAGRIARHLYGQGKWIAAAELAIEGEDKDTGLAALSRVSPLLVAAGCGWLLLDILADAPEEWIVESPSVLLARAQAACQHLAVDEALALCATASARLAEMGAAPDTELLNIIVLELRFKATELSESDFIDNLGKIAVRLRACGNDILASQAELRRIEFLRADAIRDAKAMIGLIEEVKAILEELDSEDPTTRQVRGRALGLLAALISQKTWSTLLHATTLYRIKHVIDLDEKLDKRVETARSLISGLADAQSIYRQALECLEGTDELAHAHLVLGMIHDRVDMMSSVLAGLVISGAEGESIHNEGVEALSALLPFAAECEKTLRKLRSNEGLASLYVEVSRLYALIGNEEERIRFARKARTISEEYGYVVRADLARRLESGELVPDFLKDPSEDEMDARLAASSDKELAQFTETILEGFKGRVNVEEVREAVTNDAIDMRAVAVVRGNWCRHVVVLQDLRHTHSEETIYREIPDRKIVCTLTGRELDIGKEAFVERWDAFRGYHCIGCADRAPRPTRGL